MNLSLHLFAILDWKTVVSDLTDCVEIVCLVSKQCDQGPIFSLTTVCSELIWRLVFRDFEKTCGSSCKKNFENILINGKIKFSVH